MEPGVQFRIHKGSPIIPILNQINPIPHIDAHFFKIYSKTVMRKLNENLKQEILIIIRSKRISRLLSKYLKIKIYKTIILTVVLYACETWSLTLREESRLRVFENRILRPKFRPKRDANEE